jgi:hypothetical protein
MLLSEIGFRCEGAARFGMDANAVLLGTKREKVSKSMKYITWLNDALRHDARRDQEAGIQMRAKAKGTKATPPVFSASVSCGKGANTWI